MSFFGCVYNEYLILYCCGLELETQDEIADRAEKQLQDGFKDINDSFSDIVNYENDNGNSNNLSGIKNFDNNSLGI